MQSVYQIINATDEEMYFTLGMFPTLEAAVAALEQVENVFHLNNVCDDDYLVLEIREHQMGWSEHGKCVQRLKYERRYNAVLDVFEPILLEGETNEQSK